MSDAWSRADQKLSNIVIGKTYTLSFDALATTPDGATVEIGTSEGDDDVLVITTDDFPNAKSYSDTFIAPSEDLWIGLWVNQNPPVTALFDNISVAEGEVVEHVTNGTFDTDIDGWIDNSSGGNPGTWIGWYGPTTCLAVATGAQV